MEEAPPRKSARVKRQEEEKEREAERDENSNGTLLLTFFKLRAFYSQRVSVPTSS